MSWDPPIPQSLGLTTVALAHGGFTKVNTADWTISNPDANTLRLVKGVAGGTGWDNATETGLALVWPVDLGAPSNDMLIQSLMRISAVPGTQGVGIGIGISEDAAGPVGANWSAWIAEREAGATFQWILASDTATTNENSGSTDVGLGHQQLYGNGGVIGWSWAADGTVNSQRTRQSGHAISGSSYLTIYAYAGAAGGTIDITQLGYVAQQLTGTV